MINDNVTGLRVKFWHDNGWGWGVARVRYGQGHTNAGRYEVERNGKDPVLVPWLDCEPAPNWDDTPEEHRFTGSEFYLPTFADRTRRAFLTTDSGVIIPGDMDRLRVLMAKIKPGWRVRWTGQEANTFRGDVTVESVTDSMIHVKGGRGAPNACRLPIAGHGITAQYGREFDVTDSGLHFVLVPPRRTGKARRRSVSLEFSAPLHH